MTGKRPVNPEDLAPPIGFAHAWLVEAPSVRTLYLAGQCGHNAEGVLEGVGDLVAQMDKAMGNIARVLEEAQMTFQDVMQLNFYVCSRNDYVVARKAFGKVWRKHCEKHYPAMAMFMVSSLFDADALIEIQGIAATVES